MTIIDNCHFQQFQYPNLGLEKYLTRTKSEVVKLHKKKEIINQRGEQRNCIEGTVRRFEEAKREKFYELSLPLLKD